MNPMYVYRVVYLSLSHCIIYSSLSKSCSSWHLEHQQYIAPIVVIVGRFWSSFHLVLALVIMWASNVLWAFIVERATKTYNQYWYPTVLALQNVNKLCISCSLKKPLAFPICTIIIIINIFCYRVIFISKIFLF